MLLKMLWTVYGTKLPKKQTRFTMRSFPKYQTFTAYWKRNPRNWTLCGMIFGAMYRKKHLLLKVASCLSWKLFNRMCNKKPTMWILCWKVSEVLLQIRLIPLKTRFIPKLKPSVPIWKQGQEKFLPS